jgi:drug/metabolite transporter (DMT)-like permease
VLAYLFWNRGVAEVGANRAGQFLHLIPLFGTALAVVFLGETLRLYHLAGAALIFVGIYLAAPGARKENVTSDR